MSVPASAIGAMLGEFGHYVGWWPGKANANGQVEDVSGQGNHLTRKSGLSLAAMTANPGYFTTVADGAALGHVTLGNGLPFHVEAGQTLILSMITKNSVADSSAIMGNVQIDNDGLLIFVNDATTWSGAYGFDDGGNSWAPSSASGNVKSGLDAHLGLVIDARRRRVAAYFNGVISSPWENVAGLPIRSGRSTQELAFGHDGSAGIAALSVAAQFKNVHLAIAPGAVNESRMNALMARLFADSTAYIRASDIQP